MRTISFASVLNGVVARMGLDPTITPAPNTLAAFSEYVNSAVRSCWEIYPWPELTLIEQRSYYPAWDSTASYSVGNFVLGSDGTYYYAKAASSGSDPTTDSSDTYWQSASDYTLASGNSVLYAISLDQASKTAIGEVLDVFTNDPRVSRYSPRVNWWLTSDGIVITNSNYLPSQVWIRFTTRPTIYSSTSYTDGSTIPYILSEAVKHLACAMALREDGQYDKATIMDQQAEEYMGVEWSKIESKQQQSGRFMVLSR